jgi:choline dehydrogenase-like flavoprotein
MSFFDAIVVGSGPAGTFSSYALRGRKVLLLDVGYEAPGNPDLKGNFYDLRRNRDLFESLIGEDFEGLHNLRHKAVSLKLKAPYMSYIIRDWERLTPLSSKNFEPVISLARGGLANAWGAGVYRFTGRDMAGWPLTPDELEPYYDELTRHIGIAGVADDLAAYFGTGEHLLPPLRISAPAARLLEKYESNRRYFHDQGIFIGRSRLAVTTVPHRNRGAYEYDNLEFFKPYNPSVYNPAFTLDEMVEAGQIAYQPGYLVTHYREHSSHVEVFAKHLASGNTESFSAKLLFLAAGALNTGRIVLQSNGDFQTRLGLLDNPMSAIPFFDLRRIGAIPNIQDGSLAQLNLILDSAEAGPLIQASLYSSNGPLRSDILFQLPLAASACLTAIRKLSSAMALLMLFYPDSPGRKSALRLNPGGELEADYEPVSRGAMEARLIAALRHAGYFTSAGLCQYPPPGTSLHFAGTIPMRTEAGPYTTDPAGLLSGAKRIYIADSACFPTLPAKNLTFTIMANAMRISTLGGNALP